MRDLLRPRLPRLLLAIVLGVLSLGSALALAGVSAWLITGPGRCRPCWTCRSRWWRCAHSASRAACCGYCERLASHDTALRAAADTRETPVPQARRRARRRRDAAAQR